MFNPNARRQYEIDDYDERVECICTIVPIFDDFEQVYGVIGIDTMTCPEREVFRLVSKLILARAISLTSIWKPILVSMKKISMKV